MEGPVSLTVPLAGSNTYTFPLAGTLPAPSPLPAAGSYSSTFTGTDFEVIYSGVEPVPALDLRGRLADCDCQRDLGDLRHRGEPMPRRGRAI